MADQTPAEMREQAKRLREHPYMGTKPDARAGADALDELAEQRERPKIEIHIEPARCMACGLPDHQCPTGGRLLR